MPKLTRSTFIAAVGDLWGLAQRNFDKDGYVHGCLVAVDSMSRQHFFMHGPVDDPRILANGIVPVPGPWLDHLPQIEAQLREWKTVAAIMVGEAWKVSGEYAVDVISMDLAPNERPVKTEIVFVAGFWPREHVALVHQGVIERDEHGENARLRPIEDAGPEDSEVLVSWLSRLLPQPH